MPTQQKSSLRMVALIFATFGILMLAGGLFFLYERNSLVSNGGFTEGTVIEIFLASSKKSGLSEQKTYAPRIQFSTAEKDNIEFRATASSSDPGYRVGDVVPVVYRKDNPEQAKINTFFHLWLFPTFISAFGGLFSLLGFGIFILDHKERRLTGNASRTAQQT